VLFDESLSRYDVVYPAAGTPSSMVRMRRDDLLVISRGRVARISL
jgi:prolyl-tRNA editing enzyme YbaK/EbsC (Cys-tRNA(Pro) deacylase)